MTFADAKERFSSRVADYVKFRPGYPAAILDLLRDECGLRAGESCVVADVGSGTGFLAELFLKQGNRVFGVADVYVQRRVVKFVLGFGQVQSCEALEDAVSRQCRCDL